MGELGNNSTQSTAFSISNVFDFDLMTLRIRHFYYGCSLKFEIYRGLQPSVPSYDAFAATGPRDPAMFDFDLLTLMAF